MSISELIVRCAAKSFKPCSMLWCVLNALHFILPICVRVVDRGQTSSVRFPVLNAKRCHSDLGQLEPSTDRQFCVSSLSFRAEVPVLESSRSA